MVWDHKQGVINDEEYTERYTAMMRESFISNRKDWDRLFRSYQVTLVCFCAPGKFCHRVLLARMLEKLGAQYTGEV
jgi:uncharacterized protein YeaO (DUF488 family)